jgi:hypothetical protein
LLVASSSLTASPKIFKRSCSVSIRASAVRPTHTGSLPGQSAIVSTCKKWRNVRLLATAGSRKVRSARIARGKSHDRVRLLAVSQELHQEPRHTSHPLRYPRHLREAKLKRLDLRSAPLILPDGVKRNGSIPRFSQWKVRGERSPPWMKTHAEKLKLSLGAEAPKAIERAHDEALCLGDKDAAGVTQGDLVSSVED